MSEGKGAQGMLSIWVEKGGEWTWKGKGKMTSTLLIALCWGPSASSSSISLASVQVVVTCSEKDGGKVVQLLGQPLSVTTLPQVTPDTTLSVSTNTVKANQL